MTVMRAVVQRVSRASVEVDGKEIASIGEGIMVLVGIHRDDSPEDMKYIRDKILGLRIFDDDQGVMNLSVEDAGGEVLLVSQFTLHGDARRGRRPSYSAAMSPDNAVRFFEQLVESIRNRYPRIQAGIFGADMDVSLVNRGPVTIILDSTGIL